MRYLEDFLAGATYRAGSVQLSETEILEFARRYDPQPFHVDPEAARATIYGGLIASGWHTVAATMRLLVDNVFAGSASMGSPGVDQIRWLAPVRPGDTLRPRVSVLETRPSRSKPDRGLLRFRVEVENQDDVLVMSLEGTAFVGRRPPTPV